MTLMVRTIGARWMMVATLFAAALFLAVAPAYAGDAPNEWFNATGPVAPGLTQVDAIDVSGDADWYYFYATNTGDVQIAFDHLSGETKKLALFQWDGGQLNLLADAWAADYGGEVVTKPLSAGLYYVRVRGLDTGYTGGYTFTVTGAYVSASHPSNVQAHPTPVVVPEDSKGTYDSARGPVVPTRPYVGAIDVIGDVDWYYFYASGTGDVRIAINCRYGDSTDLTLYRWDGAYLRKLADGWAYSDSENNMVSESVPAGLYYVKVNGGSEDYTGGYDFTVSGTHATAQRPQGVSVPPAPVVLPEDGRSTPPYARGPLPPGRPHASAIEVIGDADWYCFFTSGVGEVKVGLNHRYGDAIALDLYWSRSDGLTYLDGAYAASYENCLLVKPLPAGLYYVRVEGLGEGNVGGYDLSVVGAKVVTSPSTGVYFSAAPYLSRYTHTYRKTYTIWGNITPQHATGSTQIKVKAYRRTKQSNGTYKYVYKKTFDTAISNASWSESSKYKGSVRLPYKGRWRLRAYHPADSMNKASYSSYRYVTVK